MVLTTGQRFLFLGDSITEADPGYTRLFAAMMAVRHPLLDVDWVHRGVSGNKVTDVAERLTRDVLAAKPDWVSIAIGINDVWHGFMPGHEGVPLPTFRRVYRDIVGELVSHGIRLVLVTPTIIQEDQDSQENHALEPYGETVRR
jgi:lysophospholipase L1-like esterase